jgi:hypothetical protein
MDAVLQASVNKKWKSFIKVAEKLSVKMTDEEFLQSFFYLHE